MVKIFADGARVDHIRQLAPVPSIHGFTTNPSLMRAAGVTDYQAFAAGVLHAASGKSVSFEVFADDAAGMERQARIVSSWGRNVLVKIPVTNTKGLSTAGLISTLTADGVRVNVTAIMTLDQAAEVIDAVRGPGSVVSVFAGRIADTGVDPEPIMRDIAKYAHESDHKPDVLWASTRELFNYIQAGRCNCDIITITPELISKLSNIGRDLAGYSLETVRQFYNDARGLVL